MSRSRMRRVRGFLPRGTMLWVAIGVIANCGARPPGVEVVRGASTIGCSPNTVPPGYAIVSCGTGNLSQVCTCANSVGATLAFDWWMPNGIGADSNNDGIIDLSPPGNPGAPGSYIPSSWTIGLNACATNPHPISYLWDVYTPAGVRVDHRGPTGCVDTATVPAQGPYNVTLTAHYADHDKTLTKSITVKNYLIVSLGDSIASGQGNPDKPAIWAKSDAPSFLSAAESQVAYVLSGPVAAAAVLYYNGTSSNVASPPVWENQSCHRSAKSGPALAALALEQADPHSSVTFISEACCGAAILHHDGSTSASGGVLDPYRGEEPLPNNGTWVAQVAAVATVLCPPGTNIPADTGPNWVNPAKSQCRPIDALVMTAGADDFGFGIAALGCSVPDFDCSGSSTPAGLVQLAISNGIANLPANLSTLNSSVRSGLNADRIYFAEYPDILHDGLGALCSSIVLPHAVRDAVNSGFFGPLLAIGVDVFGVGDGQITQSEVKWLHDYVYLTLKQDVAAASRSLGWIPIEGVADEFLTHGYCAQQPWVIHYEDSVAGQLNPDGTFHPNNAGHQAYSRHIYDTLRATLPGSLNAQSVSAQQSSLISAKSWGANRFDVFAIGSDWTAQHKAWNGTSWLPSTTTLEGLGGTLMTPPTVVSWGANRLDLFAGATDGSLKHKWMDNSPWTPSQTDWENLGGIMLGGPPAAVSWGANRIDLFVRGTDGGYYWKYWNGSAWKPSQTDWTPLGGVSSGPPVAVSWGANRIDLFALGTDGVLYHKWFDGSNWSPSQTGGWESLGGTLVSMPAAVSSGANHIDLFGQGTDGALYWKSWDGSHWSPSPTGWTSMGGTVMGPPAAVSRAPSSIDLFVEFVDGAFYHKAWNGTSWAPSLTDWEPHGGGFTSPPAVTSWGVNQLDIFGRGTDGALYHQAWNGTGWVPSQTGWENRGGSLH